LQIQQLQAERDASNAKLDKLSQVLQGMAITLQTMSDTQVVFHEKILKERRQASLGEGVPSSASRQVSTARHSPSPAPIARPVPVVPKSREELELDEITKLMEEGRYEEGSIRWLQSTQPVELFDNLFVRFTPEYLATDVSPLVAFSVAVTVANSLATNTPQRLEWISSAFDAVDLRVRPLTSSESTSMQCTDSKQDPEIADLSQHAPALISSLIQKLESLYMTMAEHDPADPVLRTIPSIAKKARDMKAALLGDGARTRSGTGFGAYTR